MEERIKVERILCNYSMEYDADECVGFNLHSPYPKVVFENIDRYSLDRLKVQIDNNAGVEITNDDWNNFEVGFQCEKVRPKRDDITGELNYELKCEVVEK